MSTFISAYSYQPVYDTHQPAQVTIEPTVKRQVDLILGENATAEQRERAYQLVQAEVNDMGGVGDAGIVEEAIPEYAARLLQENNIPTVADHRVVDAVDAQLGADATPEQRREAYELMQSYVNDVGGIGDAGIVEEALSWQAGKLLRQHGLPARISQEVADAVDSQISQDADFAQRMRAYDIVQEYVDSVGGVGDHGIVAEALPGRAGELLRENRIQTQVRDLPAAMDVLDRDFAVFDTAYENDRSEADGKISIEDLQTVRDGGDRFTAEQRSLAAFLLDSPTYRNYLDVGAGKRSVDGTISRNDLNAVKDQVPSGEQYHRLLDTADGNGGLDGDIGPNDIDALLADPHAPDDLKDALRLLKLGGEDALADVESFISGLTPHRLTTASELYNSSQFQALPDGDKRLVAEIFRNSGGNALTMAEVKTLLETSGMTAGQRTAALTRIAIENSPEFRALPQSDRDLVTRALTNGSDSRVPESIRSLLEDGQFAELSTEQKTAVLSQVANYPDSRSIANLERLIQKDWFQDFGIEDQQRALKLVAFLSQYNGGDATVIANTLDKFLAADAPYTMDFEAPNGTFGTALDDEFHLFRGFVDAGNGPLDTTNDDTMHLVTHTFAHEVNHLVNGDTVSETFEYFNAEYRGFYVGFRAEHGRDPTVDEVLDRVRFMLTATDGAYENIAQALQNGGTESEQIIAFMERLLGRNDVTAANAATLDPTNGGALATRPQGNLTND
ncbi:MAG TPA: hypothetical protein VGD45_06835 [Steroidobacter sp.]|uniref:hypothetical protein n=1 Tax=Steroidobacter sp. TaxID=1978227 RepID=UPI002ED8F2A7